MHDKSKSLTVCFWKLQTPIELNKDNQEESKRTGEIVIFVFFYYLKESVESLTVSQEATVRLYEWAHNVSGLNQFTVQSDILFLW